MDFHEKSTQHRWTFDSPSRLQALREQSAARGFANYVETVCPSNKPVNTPYSAFGKLNVKSPVPTEAEIAKISPPVQSGVSPVPFVSPVLADNVTAPKELPERLTAEDELDLVNYFTMNMIVMCTTLLEDKTNRVIQDLAKEPKGVRCAPVFGHLPPEVLATAILFFKRLYLNHSVLQHDPVNLSQVCIYLALKVEDIRDFERIEKFLKALGNLDHRTKEVDESEFHHNELTLLQGINFHLAMHHPYRCIRGCIESWKLWSRERIRDAPLYKKISEVSQGLVKQLLFEDTLFLYGPAYVALACLRRANQRVQKKERTDFDDWLEQQCSVQKNQELLAKLNEIDTRFLDVIKPTLQEQFKLIQGRSVGPLKKYKVFAKSIKKIKSKKKRAAEKPPVQPSLSSGKKFKVDKKVNNPTR